MSDLHLREAERRFRASGCVEDESELLRARLRLGLVDRDRLAVAAYAGHPAARFLLGVDAPAFTTTALHDRAAHAAWTEVARKVGQAVAVSTAEAALRVVFSGRTRAWLTLPQLAIVAAHLRVVRELLAGERREVTGDRAALGRAFRRGPARHCLRASFDLLDAALSTRDHPRHTADALRAAGSAATTLGMAEPADVDAAARAVLVRHGLGPARTAGEATTPPRRSCAVG